MPELSAIQILYTVLLATTLLTQGLIAAWVYRYQWDQSGAKWFLIMVGTGMVWVLPYTFFFVVTNPTYQYVAHVIGLFGALSTVCAFVVFASTYTEAGFHHNRLLQAHLGVIIGGYLLLAPTNNMHHLLFADFRAVSEPFSYIAVQRGVVFWGMLLSLQIPGLYAYYRLVTHLRSSQRHGGRQLLMFLVGALSINTLDHVDNLTTLLPMDGFPDALLGMFVFYVFIAVALFKFNLLDVKPVARKTVIENLHDPVLVIEKQNRLVDFNQAATAVWPALPDRLLDPFATACPEVEATIKTPLEGTVTTELTIERDGVEHHYSVTASAVTADGAETGWYSIVLREITNRREREQELEELTTRLQLALDETDTGVWEWDLDTDDVIWDETSEQLFGYDPGEFPDSFAGFANRVPDDDLEYIHGQVDHAIETGEQYRAEFRVRPPESDQRWVQVRGVVQYDDEGTPDRMIGVQTDITERKEREQELTETKRELEQSNEKLDQFAYVASHDLQEPLRMVSQYMTLIEQELGDELDGAMQDYLDFAVDGAERMEAMIDGLLDYSRVQTQADPFERVDTGAIIERTRRDLGLKIEETGAKIEVGELPTVTGDAEQLGQVFQNLIKNAVEHGGQSTLVELTATERADVTEFAVADNGPGIPESKQADIFDIFDKGGDSDGTGIGLAVCQEVVERHGGEIWVDSTEDEGTTFFFTIPDEPVEMPNQNEPGSS